MLAYSSNYSINTVITQQINLLYTSCYLRPLLMVLFGLAPSISWVIKECMGFDAF